MAISGKRQYEDRGNLTITQHLDNLKDVEQYIRSCGPAFNDQARKLRRAITAMDAMHQSIKKYRRSTDWMI